MEMKKVDQPKEVKERKLSKTFSFQTSLRVQWLMHLCVCIWFEIISVFVPVFVFIPFVSVFVSCICISVFAPAAVFARPLSSFSLTMIGWRARPVEGSWVQRLMQADGEIISGELSSFLPLANFTFSPCESHTYLLRDTNKFVLLLKDQSQTKEFLTESIRG